MIRIVLGLFALLAVSADIAAATAMQEHVASRRVEAQSQNYHAVGVVDGDRMSIRLARTADNAPVSDVAIEVSVRSISQTAVAQPDGSYQVRMPVLTAPGEALVALNVSSPSGAEKLQTKLAAPQNSDSDASGGLRQGLWWVLNFAVCIGLLLLISRRKRAAAAAEDQG